MPCYSTYYIVLRFLFSSGPAFVLSFLLCILFYKNACPTEMWLFLFKFTLSLQSYVEIPSMTYKRLYKYAASIFKGLNISQLFITDVYKYTPTALGFETVC